MEVLKISTDHRDIYDYLSLEQYLIERNFSLNYQEYVLLSQIVFNLGIDCKFKPHFYLVGSTKEILLGNRQFVQTYMTGVLGLTEYIVKKNRVHSEIHFWANVVDNEEVRKRNFQWNIEDAKTIADLQRCLDERNRLLNDKENDFFQKKLQELKMDCCQYKTKSDDCYIYFHDEYIIRNNLGSIEEYFYYFDDLILGTIAGYYKDGDVKTNIRPYHPCSLVRKRES